MVPGIHTGVVVGFLYIGTYCIWIPRVGVIRECGGGTLLLAQGFVRIQLRAPCMRWQAIVWLAALDALLVLLRYSSMYVCGPLLVAVPMLAAVFAEAGRGRRKQMKGGSLSAQQANEARFSVDRRRHLRLKSPHQIDALYICSIKICLLIVFITSIKFAI